MESFTRETMKRYGYPNWETAMIPFEDTAYQKLYREMCAGKIRSGDKQDLRQFLRKIDLAGHYFSYVTTHAAMSDEGGIFFFY